MTDNAQHTEPIGLEEITYNEWVRGMYENHLVNPSSRSVSESKLFGTCEIRMLEIENQDGYEIGYAIVFSIVGDNDTYQNIVTTKYCRYGDPKDWVIYTSLKLEK